VEKFYRRHQDIHAMSIERAASCIDHPGSRIAFPSPRAYHSRREVSAMIPCRTIQKIVVNLAVAFVAASAFAQAPPKYDPATETKVKGAVQEFRLVPPAGPKPVGYLVVKSGADSVQVFLGPKSFLDDMGANFKAGDEVEVTGSKVKQDGADLVLARQVVKGDDTLTLRFNDGKPAW
jgi:hypothetical protein